MARLQINESPDWDELFDDYVSSFIEEEIKHDKNTIKRLLDKKTIKNEVHNIVFNNIKDWAVRTKEKPGNIRKYGIVKHSYNFVDKAYEKAKKYGTDVKGYTRDGITVKGYFRTKAVWTENEIKIIKSNPNLSPSKLAKLLPNHTKSAVSTKRLRILA